jgi:hypothetical protein
VARRCVPDVEKTTLRVGFVRSLDAASLIVAKQLVRRTDDALARGRRA